MGKPNTPAPVKPVTSQEIKPVVVVGDKAIGDNNLLANFINSENTDITVEKNEAEINDEIDKKDESEMKKPGEKPDHSPGERPGKSAQEKLKDMPKKYWKNQTV